MFESLKNREQFRYVYRNGRSYANKYLVMYTAANHLDRHRLGISVSKKVGNSVIRHRLIRLIRESGRLNKERLSAALNNEKETKTCSDALGKDIVVIARAAAKGRGYREIESAFLHLAGLHGMMKR